MQIKRLFKEWVWDRMVFPSLFHPKSKFRPKAAGQSVGFYSLGFQKNDGTWFSFEHLKGKKVLILNTASGCGYTHQYADWEAFYQANKPDWEVLAFPSNQFLGQEPGSDKEIATFCEMNFNIDFPLFKKSNVRGKSANEVYQWLTNPKTNGWNEAAPAWNFSKYVVDQKGALRAFFPSKVRPRDPEFTQFIKSMD